jgi:hypothetical protein
MSKLGCPCGNTIRDGTSGLPHKASLLKDSLHESFSDWLVQEIQSYVTAVECRGVREWLMGRGYGEDFIALQLDHGNVLHDHIHTKYLCLKRDVYECHACGRIHVETKEDNMFVAYAPESRKKNGALSE